jgi:hypothetical protein
MSEARAQFSRGDPFYKQNALSHFGNVTLELQIRMTSYIADTALTQILGYANSQKV